MSEKFIKIHNNYYKSRTVYAIIEKPNGSYDLWVSGISRYERFSLNTSETVGVDLKPEIDGIIANGNFLRKEINGEIWYVNQDALNYLSAEEDGNGNITKIYYLHGDASLEPAVGGIYTDDVATIISIINKLTGVSL